MAFSSPSHKLRMILRPGSAGLLARLSPAALLPLAPASSSAAEQSQSPKPEKSTPLKKKASKNEVFCPADFGQAFPDFLPQGHWPWRNPIAEKLERRDMLQRRLLIDIPEFYVGILHFPDFLPQGHWPWRNPIAEKLERRDMLHRRLLIDIPEFYVGSILAVTLSDRFVSGQKNRFLGICIARERTGLRHNFTLRNVIDGMGVEIMYEMYNPLIQKIEVIRLEKWLDENLSYLRDAREEFSTFPLDLHPTSHPPGAPVPVNTAKVLMKAPPYSRTWLAYDLKNVDMEEAWRMASPLMKRKQTKAHHTVNLERVEKFDIVSAYRSQIPQEDQLAIAKGVCDVDWSVLEEMVEEEEKAGGRRPLFRHRNRRR